MGNQTPFDASVGLLRLLVRYVNSRGVTASTLFKQSGTDPRILTDPDTRLPIETLVTIEARAAELCNDEFFGLHRAEFVEPGHYGIVGYLMMNSATLAEAMEKSGRYHRLVITAVLPDSEIEGATIKVRYKEAPGAPCLPRHTFDAAMGSFIVLCRKLTGQRIVPIEVGYAFPPPSSDAEHRRLFRCPVHWDRKENFLRLDPALGTTPTLHPDENLAEYFESYARRTIDSIEHSGGVSQRLKRIAVERLDGRGITVQEAAQELGMSVRALQSHLTDEQTTFSSILKATREAAAKTSLRDGHTLEETAFLLGYSDASAFAKAFRSWTGMTPSEYRRLPESA